MEKKTQVILPDLSIPLDVLRSIEGHTEMLPPERPNYYVKPDAGIRADIYLEKLRTT